MGDCRYRRRATHTSLPTAMNAATVREITSPQQIANRKSLGLTQAHAAMHVHTATKNSDRIEN